MNDMILRKPGRPSLYKFDTIEPGGMMEFEGIGAVEVERIRAAALSFGRRSGRMFSSKKTEFGILIARIY